MELILLLLLLLVSQKTFGSDIEIIQSNFIQSHIVPDLLPSFNPTALIDLNFSGVGSLTSGQLLTKSQVASAPVLSITPSNASVVLTGTYTLFMVDADVVGADLSKGVNRHWLVNNLKITDGKLDNTSATAITAYAGPAPAPGSGPHRYTIILYEQPPKFVAPAGFDKPIGVTLMDLNSYVKNSNLGPLLAANYLRVQDGTPTASIPSTSPVITSTFATSTPAATPSSNPKSSGALALRDVPLPLVFLVTLTGVLFL